MKTCFGGMKKEATTRCRGKKSAGKLLESLPINFRTSLVITFCYLNQEVDLGGRRRWKINVYSTEVKWPSLPEELQELLVIPPLLIPESPLQWIFTFHLIPFSHLTYAKTAAPTRRLHLDVPYKSFFSLHVYGFFDLQQRQMLLNGFEWIGRGRVYFSFESSE